MLQYGCSYNVSILFLAFGYDVSIKKRGYPKGCLEVEVYQYIGSAKYRLPIWQIFQYRQSVFFEIVLIFLSIFYTSTNWLILLMHCLVVTIFYCVDNHFTSFVAILLLLTMNFIILYVQYVGKTACYVYVTGFAKTCIVHTSNFSTLKSHKIFYKCQINLKLSGFVK